jgi:hypothetical protein
MIIELTDQEARDFAYVAAGSISTEIRAVLDKVNSAIDAHPPDAKPPKSFQERFRKSLR